MRGLHYQAAPKAQPKLVSCLRGAIFDVAVDINPESATYKQWVAVELEAESGRSLFIPEGFAHGFQTITDETVVFYHMFEFYSQEFDSGYRWDDPAFNITWPQPEVSVISERDNNLPLLKD